MIFKPNLPKNIRFEVLKSENINFDKTTVFARIKIKNIVYCIEGEFINNDINIDIPPLKDFVKEKISGNQKYDISIEIITDDTRLVPFDDTFSIENEAKLEIKMKENKEVKKHTKIIIEKKKTNSKHTITLPIIEKTESIEDKFLNS